MVPLDPPEKLTIGEHSPASVFSVFWVADTRDPLSVTTAPSSLLFKIQISYNLAKIISPVPELFVMIHGMASC